MVTSPRCLMGIHTIISTVLCKGFMETVFLSVGNLVMCKPAVMFIEQIKSLSLTSNKHFVRMK